MASPLKTNNSKKHSLRSVITQVVFVVLFLVCWQAAAKSGIFNSLAFPSLGEIGSAFVRNFTDGYAGKTLWVYTANSMILLFEGLAIGMGLAFLLSGLSMVSKTVYDIYNLMVSVFDLLPGVALLPVAMTIFGINTGVIVFLVVHAVLWPMSRSVLDGFLATPQIYIEAGKNIGLRGVSLLMGVYIPAATSYIVSGLKVGWARAWRGLLSAEMIFGVMGSAGIGVYIQNMRTTMKSAEMYATLLVIILVGMVVQYGILSPIEKATVKKWGMAR